MTNFDTSAGLYGGAVLRLTVTETSQNTGMNQSTDAWSETFIKGTYASYDLSGTTYSYDINGTTGSGSFTFDFRSSSSKLVASGSGLTVTHLSDGTKTISVSASIGNTGTSSGGPATAAGSFAQTPITAAATGGVVSRLSHTLAQPFEYYAFADSEAEALSAIASTASEITLDTLPSELSTAVIEFAPVGTALDAFNSVLLTEQGDIYSTVTGSLTSPVEKLTVRERTRPSTVTAEWDVQLDLQGAPDFVRQITNMVSTTRVAGPTETVSYTDETLIARVGSANDANTVLNTAYVDLLAWGQDRVQRGANVQLRVASVTIDAMNTATDRSADLLALTPGDRHRFIGLPSTVLGFDTWDGWLLGGTEVHSVTEHKFTLYFQPVLPDTAIYDTNLFMADGVLALSSSIDSSVTSMDVTTSVATILLETVTFPYTVLIDSEELSVTACTTAAPQVATVTRGVNGTTAASHSSGALVEVATASLFAL